MLTYDFQRYHDFTKTEAFNKQKEALAFVNSQLGKEYANIIGGKEVFSEKKTKSVNPANPAEIIGVFQKSGKDQAEEAIQAAVTAFETWKYFPAEERAKFLFKAAEVCKRRRMEINAWMIKEVGKNFAEADADTAEAIDFLEFYGREMIRYSQSQPLTAIPQEYNEYFYIPLGVGLIVPPWNFPFAIMVGMTSAAIVTGNTVVLKPSSDSPMMAWLFADIMREVGLPRGVFNYFVASGAESGDYLVDHPKTRFIGFTGSVATGCRINERAAKVNPGQIWLKRVIAEMGGKDTLIVDSETHSVDAAVDATVTSAFGFQGQKCSACSRVIVDEKIYDEFLVKLIERTKALPIGSPEDNVRFGPVVSAGAEASIIEYMEIAKQEGKVVLGGNKMDRPGYFLEPTIVTDLAEDSRISLEEIFGPVLAVFKSRDFDHALKIANNTSFGLTGGVFTYNREKLMRARKEFHAGNLYFNRKITGAIVDVHPFGGFNMSGTDSKAGSRDYLLLFMQGKAVTEQI
ncbi:MAG: L-glutamate gamma-semialdehyde dehydrogenase [Ignavibacteria bacterium GWF2_33_9]|nr:MAG: L-glutamate gamma-semialdehyde dehydrogenase [Ignavibacteria bacterium GWF2_33_9]